MDSFGAAGGSSGKMRAFVLCALLCMSHVTATQRRSCSAAEAATVQREWNQIFTAAEGARFRIEVAAILFRTMMESSVFRAHTLRLVTDLDTIINLLHDGRSLTAQLRHLAGKRQRYMGAHVQYYSALTRTLMVVVPQLTDRFSDMAWENCLDFIGKSLLHQSRLVREEILRERANRLPEIATTQSN